MTAQAQTVYDETVDLLKELNETQLMAVHSVVVEMTIVQNKSSNLLGIQTEDELWNHIDHSLAQAKAGKGRDADEFIKELAKEYA